MTARISHAWALPTCAYRPLELPGTLATPRIYIDAGVHVVGTLCLGGPLGIYVRFHVVGTLCLGGPLFLASTIPN